MVPPMKEAVEEAFTAGLVKAVFATETLSLGINMPARTVVIEKLSKFTGEHHEFLTPGEYTQLAGRAGRRGLDDVGFVVVLWNPYVTFDQVAGLARRRTYALTSSFRPTYNMAVNLVRRYPPDQARHLLNLSFAQYHADRDVVSLERLLAHNRELLARQRAGARSDRGDVDEYRAIKDDLEVANGGRRRRRPRGSRRSGPATSCRRRAGAAGWWCSSRTGARRQPGARADRGARSRAARTRRLPRPRPPPRHDRAPAPFALTTNASNAPRPTRSGAWSCPRRRRPARRHRGARSPTSSAR